MGAKIGNNLDSLSTPIVTAATKQYLLPSAEGSNAQGRHALLLFVDLFSFANEPLCFLLLRHRLGSSCLWFDDVRTDDGRATLDEQLECQAAIRGKHFLTVNSLKLSLMDGDRFVLISLGILHSHDVVIFEQVHHIGIVHSVVVIVYLASR